MTIGGTAVSGISLTTGGNGLTQNGDVSGEVDARSIRQDGYTAGTLDRVSVSAEGHGGRHVQQRPGRGARPALGGTASTPPTR
jgi:hypothetical protein